MIINKNKLYIMAENNNQSNLEYKGIEKRKESIVKNDYNINDEYSQTNKDALSDGDPQGKGSGSGGHTHYLPDNSKPTSLYNYSNFDTRSEKIGGSYDINGRNGNGGRNYLKNISKYNSENQYGVNSVNTQLNILDGQIVIK